MKSKYLALMLGCVAPLAQAQTSLQIGSGTTLEIFGVLDLAVSSYSAGGAGNKTTMDEGMNSTSRLGFRGSRELGDGLKANLWLEGLIQPDSGIGGQVSPDNSGANTGGDGFTFSRRATFGLSGNWGEVRLGRDYVPTFTNLTTAMSPFGTNGAGNTGTLFYPKTPYSQSIRTNVRASNSIGYFLPSAAGGFYGAAMYAMGEKVQGLATSSNDGDYVGGRLGYKVGALNLAGATGVTKYATGDFTQSNFGINYKFGDITAMYLWGQNKVGASDTSMNLIGATWALGADQVRVAYTDLKANGVANDANHFAIGYVGVLGKGMSWYATAAQITNSSSGVSGKAYGVNGFTPADKGGSSTGFDLGLVLSF